jgi:transcription elongation factor GreA
MARGMEPIVLTQDGLERLEAELTHLKTTRRGEVADMFAEIQSSAGGDDELEVERQSVREEMGMLEARIAQLEGVLANAVVAEPTLREPGRADVGARVTVEDEGEEDTYVLVSPAEASVRRGHISIASPVGAALLGHHAGETVDVTTPAGTRQLRLLRVE